MASDVPFDSEAFKSFEHDGWAEVSGAYDGSFGMITRQAAEPLLDAVAVGPGVRLLDVACGTGYLANLAAGRGADAIGTDYVEAMVEQAQRLHPETVYRQADGEALPFTANNFDAVVCSFGMLHFADPGKAIAEAFRVLVAGGRYAFTVWNPPKTSPYFSNFIGAVQAHGDMKVPLPPGPPPHQYGEAEACHRILTDTGFLDTAVRELPIVARLENERDVLEPVCVGGVRGRKLLLAQTEEAKKNILQAAIAGAKKFAKDGNIEIPMPAVLASGRKP